VHVEDLPDWEGMRPKKLKTPTSLLTEIASRGYEEDRNC